jgi:DNA-binding response OmpR family regulator
VLDVSAQSLRDAEGRSINLTSGEFKLLETMVTRANRVLSRDQLMDACYGNNSPAFDRSMMSVSAACARNCRTIRAIPRSFAPCAMAAIFSPPALPGTD